MKKEILDRIKLLGGNTDGVKGKSLADDLQAITFNTVLYQRPEDTPWQTAEDAEPIYGIGEFIDRHEALFREDPEAFYTKITDTYFCLTEEGYGQFFWQPRLFTPFKEGTEDFDEWNPDFADGDTDLSEIIAHTGTRKPDFIALFYSYGFPDNYYICVNDPNPENPTLFGTDHEVFFQEVTHEGNLADFLATFMTRDELLELIRKRLPDFGDTD